MNREELIEKVYSKLLLLNKSILVNERASAVILLDLIQSNTESKDEWVSVAKELPTEEKYGKQVWLYRSASSENQGSKGQIFDTCMVKHCEPDSTWFMPLPQPPKQGSNHE